VADRRPDGLIVTIRSPELAEPLDLRIPGGVPVGRLLPRLVEALRLPEGAYRLLHHGEPIPEEESLFAARVLAGDILSLQPAGEEGEEIPATPAPVADSVPGTVHLADLLPSQIDGQPARRGWTTAFWSGPAGGSGRTTLALALAIRAAERGEAVTLLALSEPAVAAYMGLPRVPNVETFFAGNPLPAVEQTVRWIGEEGPVAMSILLGPARPQESSAGADQIDALVAAAQGAYDRILIDLPPLVPGGTPWASIPLARTDDILLVVPPSAAGVAATIAALSLLEEIDTTGEIRLALVRRAPGGLPLREIRAGISGLWGTCPATIEVPFWGDLPSQMERGELPGRPPGGSRDGQRWRRAVEALAECGTPAARAPTSAPRSALPGAPRPAPPPPTSWPR
jgi:hypothetical protein